MARRGRYWLGITLLALAMNGCDSASDQETAAPLIPEEALAFDAGLFTQGAGAWATAGANFLAAVVRVVPVSALVGVNLIIPSAVTASALVADPVLEGVPSATGPGVDNRRVSLSEREDGPIAVKATACGARVVSSNPAVPMR